LQIKDVYGRRKFIPKSEPSTLNTIKQKLSKDNHFFKYDNSNTSKSSDPALTIGARHGRGVTSSQIKQANQEYEKKNE